MTSLVRLGIRNFNNFIKTINTHQNVRPITLTSTLNLKQIQETQNGKELVIEGVYVESPRSKHLLGLSEGKCSLCTLGLDVKHTDVLILSQFMRSDGCMLPKRITGLCNKQQRKVSTLVTMAQKAGLIPNLAPANSKKDPTKRYGYRKYNKYFNESSIQTKPKSK